MDLVDQKDIIKAIQTNDIKLAKANLKKLMPFLKKYQVQTNVDEFGGGYRDGRFPLTPKRVESLLYLSKVGIDESRLEARNDGLGIGEMPAQSLLVSLPRGDG